MNIILGILLLIYAVIHVLFKFGFTAIVYYQLYIAKSFTFEEVQQRAPAFTSTWALHWSMLEHIVMGVVFIWGGIMLVTM